MDSEKAKEIIENGQTNALQSPGTLISEPTVVIQFYFNGDEYHTTYGNFGLTESDLDYGVHRAKNVTLSQKEDFYQNNSIEVEIYSVDDDGNVSVGQFKATVDGWVEVEN